MDELTIILTFSLVVFVVGGFYTLTQISSKMNDVAKFVLTHPKPYILSIVTDNGTRAMIGYGDWEEGVLFTIKNGKISFIKYVGKTEVKAR